MENQIDLKQLNKPVDIEHIEFRVQSISKNGWATLLAYKNARYDMNMLDEVCGAENWQRDHKELKGNIYAGIGIFISDRWVWKWDAGAESYSDKEKGEASDSFKRAGFNWGIGRELYDFPFIFLQLKTDEFSLYKDKNGKERAKQSFNLKLKEWTWNIERNMDNSIKKLYCCDQDGLLRYDSSYKVFLSDSKKKDNTSDLMIALKEIEGCKDQEQLKNVWSKYKQFQTHDTFKSKKDNLKKQLS